MSSNYKKEITIDDVLNFIKTQGYKYDYQIQQELDKLIIIDDNDIKEEINKNRELYKRMADK